MNEQRSRGMGKWIWNSLGVAAAAAGIAVATPASAAVPIDCPLRDKPFSVDSPVIDILLSPAARAAIERTVPGMFDHVPPQFISTQAPTFASIVTLRTFAAFSHLTDDQLARIDKALAAVPVTAADKTARCERYDVEKPKLTIPAGHPRLLLFQKM